MRERRIDRRRVVTRRRSSLLSVKVFYCSIELCVPDVQDTQSHRVTIVLFTFQSVSRKRERERERAKQFLAG